MNRKKKRSLLLIAQSPRPVICLSSKLFPTTRFTNANGTVAAVVPLETAMLCTVPKGCGLPAVIPYGPKLWIADTAVLPGHAPGRAVRPAGGGVRLDEVDEVAARCCPCRQLPTNRIR